MKRWTHVVFFFNLCAMQVFELGCRGFISEDPPFHVNPNMDTQPKGKAYRASDFFLNHMDMRMPLEGTIALGQLKEDEHFYFGLMDGKPATTFPKEVVVDEALVRRGQEIFNRFCAACHASIGDGDGLAGRRLLVKPTNLHSEYMYGLPPGHYFNVIANGIRTMPSYKYLINEKDIWANVAYIHVLQMSQDIDGQWIKRRASWWTQK